jgi:hypothetical protein
MINTHPFNSDMLDAMSSAIGPDEFGNGTRVVHYMDNMTNQDHIRVMFYVDNILSVYHAYISEYCCGSATDVARWIVERVREFYIEVMVRASRGHG